MYYTYITFIINNRKKSETIKVNTVAFFLRKNYKLIFRPS